MTKKEHVRLFRGDVLFVVEDFLGCNELGIVDAFWQSPGEEKKTFRVENGMLFFPSPNGEYVVGRLLLIADPKEATWEWIERVRNGREVILAPANE